MAKKKKELSLEEKLEQALVPVDEQPYEVPKNWCWVYAPSVFQIEYGKGLSTKKLTEEGFPVFGANGQIGYYSEYMYEEQQALMSCRGAYSGTMNQSLPKSFVTSNSLIIQNKYMNPSYICYLFTALNTISLVSGSAQPQVTVQAFDGYSVVLPPLEEQKRIVKTIETMFAKLDEAKEIIEETIERCELEKKRFLDNILQGNSEWTEYKLIDLLIEKPRNGYSPQAVEYETPYKSMTLSATSSGVFRPEYCKYIDEKIEDDSYLWLNTGDILIQRANSIDKVGTNAIYTGLEHEFIYPDLMMKLRVKENVSNRYISYYLKKSSIMNYFRTRATGTAGNMPKINQNIVSNTLINIPDYEKQEFIADNIDFHNAKYDNVIKLSCENISKIEEMKKSILAKAFRGELGTNIDSEESSIELLKQILEVS